MEATAEMRESIMAEIDNLKLQLDPHREKAQEVFSSHLEQYQTIVGPIAEEYQRRSEAEMAALKAKLEPIGENLRELVPRNVEETKNALMPILGFLKSRGETWLQTAKEHVGPYIQAYKTEIKNFVRNTKERAGRITDEEWTSLREKVTAHGQKIAENLMEIKRDIFG
ncbi:apolipoprotein A-I-like [Cheilinus undulatus]|nr:apolipoprotein A-I-like [Cheilinus undulatus]